MKNRRKSVKRERTQWASDAMISMMFLLLSIYKTHNRVSNPFFPPHIIGSFFNYVGNSHFLPLSLSLIRSSCHSFYFVLLIISYFFFSLRDEFCIWKKIEFIKIEKITLLNAKWTLNDKFESWKPKAISHSNCKLSMLCQSHEKKGKWMAAIVAFYH